MLGRGAKWMSEKERRWLARNAYELLNEKEEAHGLLLDIIEKTIQEENS